MIDRLYDLLPAVYRRRDAEAGETLRRFLRVLLRPLIVPTALVLPTLHPRALHDHLAHVTAHIASLTVPTFGRTDHAHIRGPPRAGRPRPMPQASQPRGPPLSRPHPPPSARARRLGGT